MIDPVVPTGLPEAPTCPFCASVETEIFSAFGSQLSVSTYWCRGCRSPFELMKWTSAGSGEVAPAESDST